MKSLVEALLTLARLEGGTLRPTRDQVALRPLADESAAELATMAAHHHVAVEIEGDAMACADQVQMRILLSNLLSNAIRYNRPHGTVRVTMGERDGRTLLRVSDTGPGLDPELAAHVFERFWRADASRSAPDGGSGLGLAISKAIVNAHGGAIACHSVLNEGTTFTVTLPRGERPGK